MSGLLVEESSLPHMLCKRTFRRPGKLSFTLGALGLFRVPLSTKSVVETCMVPVLLYMVVKIGL